jgi:hypothetical protein
MLVYYPKINYPKKYERFELWELKIILLYKKHLYMKALLKCSLLLPIAVLLLSAKTAEKTPVLAPSPSQSLHISSAVSNHHQHGFFQRLMQKLFLKEKYERKDVSDGDKLARTSLAFGIATVASLVIGVAVPIVLLATIPLGIVAMITGHKALKQGTTQVSKAKVGKLLGLGSIITGIIILIIATLAAFAGLMSWS